MQDSVALVNVFEDYNKLIPTIDTDIQEGLDQLLGASADVLTKNNFEIKVLYSLLFNSLKHREDLEWGIGQDEQVLKIVDKILKAKETRHKIEKNMYIEKQHLVNLIKEIFKIIFSKCTPLVAKEIRTEILTLLESLNT